MDRIVAEVIQEKIEPEDIYHVVQEMGKLRDEGGQPDWYSAIGILAQAYPAGSRKPVAIMERMQALGPVLQDERAQKWNLKTTVPGQAMTHSSMFGAAALAPLYLSEDGKHYEFKPDEFFAIVQEQAEEGVSSS